MRIVVKTPIDVRVGAPLLSAPTYQHIAAGSEIEVDGNLYDGDEISGISSWYKDALGNYYWSGGIKTNDIRINIQESEYNLFEKINIPFTRKGEGVVIGIFDSGVDKRYNSLNHALITEHDFLSQQHNSSILNNHGTKVAGILVGDESVITGIAPKARIISYRVIKDNQYTDDKAIIKALNEIIKNSNEVDIINMSLDINPGYNQLIQPLFDQLYLNGVIVIAAGGLYNSLNNICSFNKIIPVGVFEEVQFQQILNSGLPKNYQISFLNSNIQTTSFSDKGLVNESFKNESAYTAVLTGIVANYLSENNIPKAKRFDKVITFIKQNSYPIKNEVQPNQFRMYL